MPNQDHICIAITKSNMGGAQKYVLTLANELTKQGKKVTVLAGGDGILFEELRKRNIPYIQLVQSQRDVSFIKEIKLVMELYKIFKKIRPTVLHLNSSKLGGTGAVIGRLAGITNIIFTAHGWAFNESRPQWQKIFFYKLYWITIMLSTKTICVSKQTYEQISFLPFIKKKLEIIYNGIQVPEFYSSTEAKKLLNEQFSFLDVDKKWIVILAELHYTKGHDLMFEAIVPLQKMLEGYQIICIGSGELDGKLRSNIHYKNLEKQVFFTGFVKDAPLYLKAFEALILPSRTEALPLSILEAGLARIPVLASNVGGIPEIIMDSENGFLFEKENVSELQSKIQTLISLPDTERGKITENLSQKITENFSLQNMIDNTCALYNLSEQKNN